MYTWLDQLRTALDQSVDPVAFFFRDDDVGWHDARLVALLDLFLRHAIPIDLAVIPEALTQSPATTLVDRCYAYPDLIGLHQHGFRHVNHEAIGRKSEFGLSRSSMEQLDDISLGQRRLELLLGAVLDPIFTPPWNRCTQATVEALTTLGIQVLSREVKATALDLQHLQALPVSVDWCKRHEGELRSPTELSTQIAQCVAIAQPVGIMLHHAVMQEQELTTSLKELLIMLSQHPKARCQLMRDVAQLAVEDEVVMTRA